MREVNKFSPLLSDQYMASYIAGVLIDFISRSEVPPSYETLSSAGTRCAAQTQERRNRTNKLISLLATRRRMACDARFMESRPRLRTRLDLIS
jgi:hypothetical protein